MMWLYILNGKSRYDGVMPDISLWLEYYFRCQCRYYVAASESIIIIVIVPFMPSDVPSFVNLLAIGHLLRHFRPYLQRGWSDIFVQKWQYITSEKINNYLIWLVPNLTSVFERVEATGEVDEVN